ncbi:hypothetical protein V6N12_030465 [Hibiscus sabdariffa]|uniref:Uncharacterized protein n=1 Tax=Hibiscus sabdariffa TaxID=183260 RepID=A0ABR2C0Z4_9ROSI
MNEAVYNPFVSSHSSDAQLPPDDGEEELSDTGIKNNSADLFKSASVPLVPNVSAPSVSNNVQEIPGPTAAMHDQNNSMTDFSNQPGRDEQLDGSQEIPAAIHSGDTSHESHGYSEENASSPIDERSNDEHSISTQHTQHESDPPDPAQLNQNTSNSSVVPISKRSSIVDLLRCWVHLTPPQLNLLLWKLSFALLSGQKLISILMLAKGYRQIRATVKTLDPFSWWGC